MPFPKRKVLRAGDLTFTTDAQGNVVFDRDVTVPGVTKMRGDAYLSDGKKLYFLKANGTTDKVDLYRVGNALKTDTALIVGEGLHVVGAFTQDVGGLDSQSYFLQPLDVFQDFVATGLTPTLNTGPQQVDFTSGVASISGKRTIARDAQSVPYTLSSNATVWITYYDLDQFGTIFNTTVVSTDSQPSAQANCMRLARVVSANNVATLYDMRNTELVVKQDIRRAGTIGATTLSGEAIYGTQLYEGGDQELDKLSSRYIERLGRAKHVPLLATTLRLPFQSLRTLTSITVGDNPQGVAFDGQYVWVVNRTTNTISKIDPVASAVVATVGGLGGTPSNIAFDGTHLWVTSGSTTATYRVSKIDPITNTVVANTLLGSIPGDMAFDGEYLWVTVLDFAVKKVNVTTGDVVTTVDVGSATNAAVFDGTHIWVTNYNNGLITKIDPTTNSVVTTVAVKSVPAAIVFDGRYLWVACRGPNSVFKINPTTNAVVAEVGTGLYPTALAFDGQFVWVVNRNSNTVSKIDPVANAVVATVAVETSPQGIAFDGLSLWVSSGGADAAIRIPALYADSPARRSSHVHYLAPNTQAIVGGLNTIYFNTPVVDNLAEWTGNSSFTAAADGYYEIEARLRIEVAGDGVNTYTLKADINTNAYRVYLDERKAQGETAITLAGVTRAYLARGQKVQILLESVAEKSTAAHFGTNRFNEVIIRKLAD